MWERDDPEHPGKGQALAWALGRLPEAFPDHEGVVFVDADCLVLPGRSPRSGAELRDGASVAQADYRISNPEASPSAALRYAGFGLFEHRAPAGQDRARALQRPARHGHGVFARGARAGSLALLLRRRGPRDARAPGPERRPGALRRRRLRDVAGPDHADGRRDPAAALGDGQRRARAGRGRPAAARGAEPGRPAARARRLRAARAAVLAARRRSRGRGARRDAAGSARCAASPGPPSPARRSTSRAACAPSARRPPPTAPSPPLRG